MKKMFIISLSLLTFVSTFGQVQQATTPPALPQTLTRPVDPNRMSPGMTEIMDPEVTIVQPGAKDSDAPSDAIVLFNGMDISQEWTDRRGNPSRWIVADGALISVRGAGDIKTKRTFSSFQLHIEWRTPAEVTGEGQGRGNSGVFLQERYELQVLDSYNNRTYRNGQAGSIYKQFTPLVNVCRKPGEWQTYDIIYTAPTFNKDSTSYFTPPHVTVLQNGVLIQNNVSIRGPMEYIGIPEYFVKPHGAGSLVLQDHTNPVAYRNIWIREL